MKVNQIYSTLNSIMSQYFGMDDVTQTDLTGLIAMGETALANSNNTDVFMNALIDRIGKTIIRTLDLELEYPNLYMESFEFGCILQKISLNPFSSIENAAYKIGDQNFTPTFADVVKPTPIVRYFQTGHNTWKFQCTITDEQLFSAFTSLEMMDNFFTAIITAMTDSMTIALNDMARTCITNFIAEKIKAQNGVVNVLAMYQAAYPDDDTVTDYDSAMESPTFLRYSGKVIRNLISYMSKPSVLYNVGSSGGDIVRATARDNMHVMLLRDYTSSYITNYQSDSFNDEMVSLPLYQEVDFWQGSGDSVYDVDSFHSINVVPSSDTKQGAGGKAEPVSASGIIGVLADRQAIAIGIDKRHQGVWRNDIDQYTNHSSSALVQYINDLQENGIIIVCQATE